MANYAIFEATTVVSTTDGTLTIENIMLSNYFDTANELLFLKAFNVGNNQSIIATLLDTTGQAEPELTMPYDGSFGG